MLVDPIRRFFKIKRRLQAGFKEDEEDQNR